MENIPEPRKQDITWIVSQMEKITQRKPKLWGSMIWSALLSLSHWQ
jgi:hypothetical protein